MSAIHLTTMLVLALFVVYWLMLLSFIFLMGRRLRGRTAILFPTREDIWGKVDSWAFATGYMRVEQDSASRLYQRGKRWWLPSQMVKITAAHGSYILESWLTVNKVNRVLSLGTFPLEMSIEQGGYFAFLPRDIARRHFNELLSSLGAPLVYEKQTFLTRTSEVVAPETAPYDGRPDRGEGGYRRRRVHRDMWILPLMTGTVVIMMILMIATVAIIPRVKSPARKEYDSGWKYIEKEKYKEAAAAFGRAIKLDPNYESAYGSRVTAFNNAGQFNEAVGAAGKAIQLYPDYAYAYEERARAYAGLKRFAESIVDNSKAIELDPKYVTAYIHRAGDYVVMGMYDNAISDATKALGLKISDESASAAHTNLGLAYWGKRQKDRAIQHFRTAPMLDPQNNKAARGLNSLGGTEF